MSDLYYNEKQKNKGLMSSGNLEENKNQNNLFEPVMRQEDAVALDRLVRERREAPKILRERMNTLREILDTDSALQLPKNALKSGEYKQVFSSRVSDKKRALKITNKRSRLYQKEKNAVSMEEAEDEVTERCFASLENMLAEDQIPCEAKEYADLSAFMEEDEAISQNILKLYLGKGKNREGMDKEKALDNMLAVLSSFRLEKVDLFNDKVLSDHAGELELLSRRICAFSELAFKEDYFSKLDKETKNKVEEKLAQLNSVVVFYNLRKEIIQDPMYKTHYNDELSMDFTAAKTPEEAALAKKLLDAQLAGVDMLRKNDADSKFVVRQMNRLPLFKDDKKANEYMKNTEFDLRFGAFLDDIKDKYAHGGRHLDQAEKSIRSCKYNVKEMSESALSNVMNFEGQTEFKKDYQNTKYDPDKVAEYINELDRLNVSDLKFSSYRQMILNFKDNYALCDRVAHLQYEIAKAIMYGYKGEEFTNEKIMELRAKAMSFYSAKNTLCMVNDYLVKDKKNASLSDTQWKRVLDENLVSGRHLAYNIVKVTPGDMQKTLEACKKIVEEEEATKEESIKTVYKYILSDKDGDTIPEDELKKRKDEYQKNAFVQDFTSQDNSQVMENLVSPSMSYLKYLENKNGKVVELGRLALAMMEGKSAREVERLYKLATGTPKEQFSYYIELIENLTYINVDDYKTKNMGEFFEDWQRKCKEAISCDGQLRDIAKKMRKLMEKDPTIKLPGRYDSMDDLEAHINFAYDIGQTIPGARVGSVGQIASTKWLHAMSMKDMGSIDAKKNVILQDRSVELFMDAGESIEAGSLVKIIGSLSTINLADDSRPGEMLTFDDDLDAFYEFTKKKHEAAKEEKE